MTALTTAIEILVCQKLFLIMDTSRGLPESVVVIMALVLAFE